MDNFIAFFNDPVFKKILVESHISGKHIIYWELKSSFRDPLPYNYKIQFNRDYNDEETWETVKENLTNAISATVENLTYAGKLMKAAFRIILETSKGTYVSEPMTNRGLLSERQRLQVKTIYRRLSIFPRNYIAIPSVLLKRKWFGPRCHCVNKETLEITNTHCSSCYGTGILGGYWSAASSRLLDITPKISNLSRDLNFMQGTIDHGMALGAALGLPPIDPGDIIARRDVDLRYYVRSVKVRAEISGIPLFSNIEFGIADFDDIIYKIPIGED